MINWIASYPKSGSTWLRLLLQAYIFGTVDNGIMSTTGDIKPVYYQNVSPVPLPDLTLADINCLRAAALMQIIATWPVHPLMVKTHNANVFMDEIPLIPFRLTKRAFYVVRDPRDVCLSYAHHFNTSVESAIESMQDDRKTIQEDGSPFQHVISDWSTHVSSWLRINAEERYPVHLVRYEELHKRPGEVLGNVLYKMEIDPVTSKIDKAVELCEFSKLQKSENDNGFQEAVENRKFFRSGKIGEWKEKLTPAQAKKIEIYHSDMMKELKYV